MSECIPLVNSEGAVIGNLTRATGEKWYLLQYAIKWCFGCRKFMTHQLIQFNDSSGWYEPNLWWECSRCHHDHTEFP